MSLDKKLALMKCLGVEVKEIGNNYYVISEEIETTAKYNQILIFDEDKELKEESLKEYYNKVGANLDDLIEEDGYGQFIFEGDEYEIITDNVANEIALENIKNYLEDEAKGTIFQYYADFDDIADSILSNDGYDSWGPGDYQGEFDGYQIFRR